MTLTQKMTDNLHLFLDGKSLSENSKSAYFYDLQQFLIFVDNKVNKEKLALYEQSLSSFKFSAKKRKVSAVNQFLYFLYEKGEVDHFYKLVIKDRDRAVTSKLDFELLDYQKLYAKTAFYQGQVIALFIAEMGLTPSAIQSVRIDAIDFNFSILKLKKARMTRILTIPKSLMSYIKYVVLEQSDTDAFLFGHGDKAFSRQWLFNQLKLFLQEKGLSEHSAQSLRQQYILHQKEAGKTILEVSQNLGLKSPVTLEKYYKNGH